MRKFLAILVAVMILFSSMSELEAKTKMTDYEMINNLIISERLYRVSHRDKELSTCYAEDAQIHTSWQSGGVNSFVGQHPAESANENFNVNRCGGALIHQNGLRAFVEYPTTTIRSVKVNGVDAVLTSYMRLLYKVEKRDGVWKIIYMTSLNEADELQPAIAGTDLKINPAEIEGLRISYRWLAYTRLKAGDKISNDLLGVDRPLEVQKIYAEAMTWLNRSEKL